MILVECSVVMCRFVEGVDYYVVEVCEEFWVLEDMVCEM